MLWLDFSDCSVGVNDSSDSIYVGYINSIIIMPRAVGSESRRETRHWRSQLRPHHAGAPFTSLAADPTACRIQGRHFSLSVVVVGLHVGINRHHIGTLWHSLGTIF